MGKTAPSRLRITGIVAAAAIILSSFAVAQSASADSKPTNPQDPTTPTTVTADALPTPQIDGVVWNQKIVGNTVFAGGKWSTERPYGSAAGVNTTPQPYLLSYNLTTGAFNTAFRPALNAQVRAIVGSADGTKVYVSGSFTTVNGTTRNRVAELDATTGALITAFNATPNYVVNALALSGNTLYLGGGFSGVGNGTHNKVAAVNATTGAVINTFAADAEGGDVSSLVVSPDGTQLLVGGNFTTMNGSSNPGYGLAMVSTSTGALQPLPINGLLRNGGTQASITSLTSDATGFYGSGYVFGAGGNIEGSFRGTWADGALTWVEDCHGDTYSVAVTNTAEYVAGHPHYCGNVGGFPQTSPTWTFHRALAFGLNATQTITADPYGYYNYAGTPAPSLQNWYPDFNVGTYTGQSQGPWSVASSADSNYVVYGGEFTTINGVKQQGLTRFASSTIAPNKMGPQFSGATFKPTVVSLAAGTARLSWTANSDPDNGNLIYNVYRDGNLTTPVYTTTQNSSVWNRPSMGFTDTGLIAGSTHTYRIRATDPFGNTVIGDSVSVTVTSATPSSYTSTVLGQNPTDFWRLDESSGTAVYDWAGYNDLTAGTGVTRGAAGATGDSDTASTFSGDSGGAGLAATQTAVDGPQTFSVDAWFKTTSTDGGKIVGFGNANTGTSSSYDRHVYMGTDGKVNFGVYPGYSAILTSPTALNDGQWHQVVGTLSAAGQVLYIDGKKVGSNTGVTSAQAYSGYWRVGGDSAWSGANYFAGSIDDVSVYSTPLGRDQVNAQWVASGRQSAIAQAPTDSYGNAVYNDSPDLYWRLDEANGATTARDSGPAGLTGVYTGGVTQGVTGALAKNPDTAAAFDGSSGQVYSSTAVSDPETYSVEAWFDTTSTVGGKIIGFGDTQAGQSSSYDRHVYMQDNGQLVFGTYTGTTNTITSPASYNNGQWHHVVAEQSSAGLALYVDGALVANNPNVTQAQSYTGYWKVGGDTTWGSSSAYFAGSIDEVAVYDHALSAQSVSQHYALGAAVTPNVAPTAAFTASPTDLTAAFDASASADSDGTIASYAWDFGDSQTGTGRTTSHAFSQAGTYTVGLTVTDNSGATTTTTHQVTVTAPHVNVAPTSSFTSTPTGLSVAFDGTGSADSDGTVASYAWDFGDGSTSTSSAPTHVYAAAGSYAVKLTVTDNSGATGASTAQLNVAPVRVNQAPTAAFTPTVTNLSASFDATASSDADGTVASYAWTFGDGATSTGATPTHTYTTAGTYTVKLTVTDNEGATGTVSKSISVAPPANVPPTAAFTSTSNALALAVDGTGSKDSDGTVASYAWDFGDGSAATTATASHTYKAAGTYQVKLTVTDNSGATGSISQSVVITKAPNVAPNASFTATATGLSLAVDGTTSTDSDGTVASYAWDFGDGSSAVTATATHAYAASGVYPVKLTVTDNDGGTSTSTQSITITKPANVPPTASFTATVTGLAVSLDASASKDSDGTIASYAWDYGDSSTAGTGKTSSHTYSTAGTYMVKLTVTDNSGSSTVSTSQVTVTAPAATPFALDAFQRTVASGFGTADAGGSWSTGSGLSVAGGSGNMSLSGPGASSGSQLTAVKQLNTDVRLQVSMNKAATGGGTYLYVSGRKAAANNEYRAAVRYRNNNTVAISLQAFQNSSTAVTIAPEMVMPGTITDGGALMVRVQVSGSSPTTIRAKVWPSGTTEPTAWTVTATDSTATAQAAGSIGVGAYESGSATNGAQVVSVQQLSAYLP